MCNLSVKENVYTTHLLCQRDLLFSLVAIIVKLGSTNLNNGYLQSCLT